MKKPQTVEGSKVRPSYDELINLLDNPVAYKYPDRKASTLRNSHWLSQLDGDSFRVMDELHHNMIKEQEKDAVLRSYASSHQTSLSSLKSSHLAPSSYGSPISSHNFHLTPPQSPRQPPPPPNQPQYYNMTPPPSPRQQPATPQVFPTVPRYYRNVPDAPNQSQTIKVKSKIEKKEMKKMNKFEKMADDEFDTKVKEQHEMNVDDAELLQQQADLKREFKDLLPNLDENEIDKIVSKKLKPSKQGVKRQSEPASSSTDIPAAKAKTRKGKGDKRDAEESPEPRPKARPKPNPANEQPETIHPKRKGRPPKADSSEGEAEIQGVAVNKNTTQSYWKKQSPNEIRAQLVLRDIPRTRTGFMNKKDLLNLIKDLVQQKKW